MSEESSEKSSAVSSVATTVTFSSDEPKSLSATDTKFSASSQLIGTPNGKFSDHADEMAARHLSMLSLQDGPFSNSFNATDPPMPCRSGPVGNQQTAALMSMMRMRHFHQMQANAYYANLAALKNNNVFWPPNLCDYGRSPRFNRKPFGNVLDSGDVRSSNAIDNFFLDNANFSSTSKSSDSSFLDYTNFPPLTKNNDNIFSEQRQRSRPFPSSSPIKNFPQSQRLKENSPSLRGGEPSESANHTTLNPTQEVFARKVFIGGLPMDISEEAIRSSFNKFGPCIVDWPHKSENKSNCPPKGYAFMIFENEISVQALIAACIHEDNKYYLCVSSPAVKDKPVQVRPWRLSDADFVVDHSLPLDPRKTIFVGGVPRPLKAFELATSMDRSYGGVCYAGIDTDPELKYPKGAGRVAFSNQQSYIAAIAGRFIQLQHSDIDKRAEVKPYVLDDQMCDECNGSMCNGKYAPFFCSNLGCLQYYCEICWAKIHSKNGREHHKPLVKENSERVRMVPFKWL